MQHSGALSYRAVDLPVLTKKSPGFACREGIAEVAAPDKSGVNAT